MDIKLRWLNLLKRKLTLKKTISMAILGIFTFTMPILVDAKRLQDPEIETKVETSLHKSSERNKTINLTDEKINKSSKNEQALEKKRGTLQERIDAILHPKNEIQLESEAGPTFIVIPTVSASDPSIIGTPMASQKQCVKYLLQNNPNPNIAVSAEEIVSYYYEEGTREGIRPDVAFAQALKETGFFRYGGTVTPDQNNFCGLGTTSATVKGSYFPNPQIGVRAHIQHLLAYSSTRKPTLPLVDPRYNIVRKAYGNRTLGTWQDLNGRWAVPGNYYGQEILSMFKAMLYQ